MRRHLSVSLALAALAGCSGRTDAPHDVPLSCTSPLSDCGVACADVLSDMNHCGACGNPCTAGTLCLAGVCQPACGPLLARCGSGVSAVCADLAGDVYHCGACGIGCAAGLTCEGGLCLTPCPAGEARCAGGCVPVSVRAAGFGLPGVRASLTSGAPAAIATLDTDGDTVPDLVVLESTSATTGQVEVLRGAGDGTFSPFTPATTVALSFLPSSFALGDIDADGQAEIVVGTADPAVASVLILHGDGLGGFADIGASLSAGAGPRAVALGDLDWDGDLDLVVGDGAAVATGNLRVFLNDGAGGFGLFAGAGVPRTAHFAYSVLADVRQVAIGSFDFDYAADLLAVSAGTAGNPGGEVLIGRGDGTGSLTQPTLNAVKLNAFALADVPTAMVAADLYGHGGLFLDWTVAHAATNVLRTFVNDGSGAAATYQDEFDVAEPLALAAADLDGDGRLDLLTANGAASATWFHQNLGPSYGGVLFARPIHLPAGARPTAIAVASAGTASTWVLTANELGRNVSAARSFGTTFVVPVPYPPEISADSVALGRFDGDAWIDFAAASSWANEVRVFLQSRPAPPAPDFSASSTVALPAGAEPSAIAVGDLDLDGADDIAVTMKGLALVGLLYGDGAGSFAPLETLAVGASPSAIVLTQLDAYAGLDLSTADSGSNQVSVILSSGVRSFAAPVTYGTGPSPVALIAVDLDARGCADLVTANAGNGTLSILRCVPATPGTFQPALSVTGCTGARSVVAARADAGLLPDLVVGCADGVVVLQNLGLGAFAPSAPVFPRLDPAAMAVADLDGDGLVDLVVASPRDGGLALLRGTAGGGFSPPEIFTAGGGPVGLVIGPIDGDGQLDVVAAVTRPSSALMGAGATFLGGTCSP